MARSVAWRRTISDLCSWRQDQATNATIYILRETGPTGFLLKEDGETKKFKVYLGDPHSCTCPDFKKDKDLCKHICWVLLKKFRVPRQNPVSWQLGLVEREINEILRGITAVQRPTPNARRLASDAAKQGDEGTATGEGGIQQREIGEDDVCPICQEELLEKRLPVTYCKFGCGNNVHIKCMKIWAEHQKGQGSDTIKCPMCREDFGSISTLQQEMRNSSVRETRAQMMNEHLGTTCKKCYVCPIVGKCYKCTVCAEYYLCQACFNTPTHDHHSFNFREKPNQRWRDAPRGGGTTLPDAVVQSLMQRDISESDYDLLLQLDNQSTQQLSDLTEETIRSFPMERVRQNSTLLAPGQQCRVCLRPYQEGQFVRRLLCRHKFHRECIDNWLLHRHPTCPIDGTIYTNDSVRQIREANRIRQQRQREENSTRNGTIHPNNAGPDTTLQIPGIGIANLGNSRVLDRHMNGVLGVSGFGRTAVSEQRNQNSRENSGIDSDSSRGIRSGTEVIANGNGDMNNVPSLFVANRHSNHAFPTGNQRQSQGRGGGRATQQRGRLCGIGATRNELNNGSDSAITLQNAGPQYHNLTTDNRRNSSNRSIMASSNVHSAISLNDQTTTHGNNFGSTRSLLDDNTHNSNGVLGSNVHSTNSVGSGRVGTLNFANLLMADIQRTISRQSHHSDSHDITDQWPINDSGSTTVLHNDQSTTGAHGYLDQSNVNSHPPNVFNMSISQINGDGSGSVGHRASGGSSGQHRVRGVIRERNPGTTEGTLVNDLDITGTTVNSTQICETSTTSNSNHHQSHVRVPVPPSIPLPRDARDISLGLHNRENKPPSGGSSRTRPGRLRTRLLNKELHRIRSSSRERARSAERQTGNTRELYIGNNPETTAGFINEYVVASNEHLTNTKKAKKKSNHSNGESDERYRWGATQNGPTSDIVLSGNGL